MSLRIRQRIADRRYVFISEMLLYNSSERRVNALPFFLRALGGCVIFWVMKRGKCLLEDDDDSFEEEEEAGISDEEYQEDANEEDDDDEVAPKKVSKKKEKEKEPIIPADPEPNIDNMEIEDLVFEIKKTKRLIQAIEERIEQVRLFGINLKDKRTFLQHFVFVT